MTNFMKKTVVVTGASSGIGWAICVALAKSGANVIGVARDRERLKALVTEMQKVQISPEQHFSIEICDIRDVQKLELLAKKLTLRDDIDVLVNNAGVSYPNFLDEIPHSEVDSLLATNLTAPIHFTRFMLPYFKRRGAGHISFVGSIAGELNLIGYTVYGATKAGLFAFADSLRNELVPYGISVSIIHPADTDTPMLEGEKKIRPEVVQKISEGGGVLSAEVVALQFLKGMENGTFKIFPDFTSRVLAFAFRQFPRLMRWYIDSKVRTLTRGATSASPLNAKAEPEPASVRKSADRKRA